MPLSENSRFFRVERPHWRKLRDDLALKLNQADIERLRGVNQRLSIQEIEEVYLPLGRLVNFNVRSAQRVFKDRFEFLGQSPEKVPFIIGLAGSVAVGKSTSARILQEVLKNYPEHPRVDLISTDGFLRPNAELEARGIMNRKGFPESYDRRALIDFLTKIKAGHRTVSAPVYSHQIYDIVPGEERVIERPDILIVEGLNVLQTHHDPNAIDSVFVSDFFDYAVYLDGDPDDLQRWFLERFETFRETRFQDPNNYFHRFAQISKDDATEIAIDIWKTINAKNLAENILPSRGRANVVLHKTGDHEISWIALRKL